MESIRIWLNGERKYTSGVKLYILYGKDNLLKRLFASPGESEYKAKRLSEALSAILEGTNPKSSDRKPPRIIVDGRGAIKRTVEATNKAKNIATVLPKGNAGWSKEMDPVEAAMYNKWKPVFNELMELSSRLYEVAIAGLRDPYKEIEACKMALRILDLEDECNEFYRERDHYVEHGKELDKYPYGDPCRDSLLIPQKLANAQRYVRDYKLKLDKKPNNVNAAEQLQKHQWFVDYYKKQLKLS